MSRQIVLDTETTGLRVEEGHRIIEIGCVELIDRKFTGRHFHCYLNPNREIDPSASAIHGITNDFIQDKPSFHEIAEEFIEFLKSDELIIHNASFDLSFIDNEFSLIKTNWTALNEICKVIDTLQMARRQFVGQRNNLDALCKRLKIDNSKREFHGALLDAHLLAQVYLAMTGGQGTFFESMHETDNHKAKYDDVNQVAIAKEYKLIVLHANEAEETAHAAYLEEMNKRGKCLWLQEKNTDATDS